MKFLQRLARLSFYLALFSGFVGFGVWQSWKWWEQVIAPPVSLEATEEKNSRAATAKVIKIAPGTPAQQIGQQLESAGLIRSATAWKLWTRWLKWKDSSGEFKSGTYQLSPTQPMTALAEKIWQGDVMTLTFTIPEGWSIKRMAQEFESKGFFKAEEFIKAASQIPKSQYPWLPDGIPHLEGFLFPDTYQLLSDDITPQAVLKQMLDRFQEVALPLYQQSQKPNKLSLLEWVTLASIVEKESVIPSERYIIAGVFTRRLQEGMTLGSDPTVEYGLGITQTPDQPLTFAQVKTPNPYNTYINPGLPPTPIASPGLASLKAALNPQKTEYLYFVARYDGSHVFSRTLAEHEAAQNAIHNERAQKRQSQSPKSAKP